MSAAGTDFRAEGAGFARFCVVGAAGFVIDAGLLMLFIRLAGLDPFTARVLSILLAITATWMLHRAWTFGTKDPGRFAEWSRFLAVNGAGGTLNYLVYSAILVALPGTAPLIALCFGSAAALIANYCGSRFWAFRKGGMAAR